MKITKVAPPVCGYFRTLTKSGSFDAAICGFAELCVLLRNRPVAKMAAGRHSFGSLVKIARKIENSVQSSQAGRASRSIRQAYGRC
jgi:hypothetical protein